MTDAQGLDERLDGADRADAVVLASPGPGLLDPTEDLDPPAAAEWVHRSQRVLARIERLPVPTYAAIAGDWLGGAAELALACGGRLAADDTETRIAFPDVALARVPALGATVRLPRLIGLEAALDLILSAAPVDPYRALGFGLVDALLPAGEFREAVIAHVVAALGTRSARRRRRALRRKLLEDTAPGRRLIGRRAIRRAMARPGESPGVVATAVDLVTDGVAGRLEGAFERAAHRAAEAIATPESRALAHAARVTGALIRSAERRVREGGAPPVAGAAVVGAGETAAACAHLLACAGVAVRLRHADRARVRAAIERVLHLLALDVAAGRIDTDEADRRESLISSAYGYGGFGTLDLVVVAESAGPGSPEETVVGIERHTGDDCIVALAGAGESLAGISARAERPERLLALHVYPPTAHFPLVELEAGPATDPGAVRAVERVVRGAGRVPYRSTVAGGLGYRLLSAGYAEALRLVREGTAPAAVDAAVEAFGLPLGPFRRPGWPRPTEVGAVRGDAESCARLRVAERVVGAMRAEAEAALAREHTLSADAVDALSILALGYPRTRGGLLFEAAGPAAPA